MNHDLQFYAILAAHHFQVKDLYIDRCCFIC